ncbi:hypothetical protein LTR36_000560 [Oleoguttula mirabilis]|uniref:RNA polymerase II degradation factor 1 n=1 Tax=Oleoguttula mirabilis TaxID=1507867 RepID=A0AAV9JQW3_9PEZI|nr:hypothetical protein LTR36_000560 [Oleoguttula mirabilis]
MSEVEARPPPNRGRSSFRGGRGGFGRGGPRGGRKPMNGTLEAPSAEEAFEEQGELGEMKKKFAPELGMLRDMFPDWTDTDLVFALQETDGDVANTVDKITQGNVSQFAEVKKPKDRARSKVKEEPAMAGATDRLTARGGRGRGGFDAARGGRGRGSDRGRGAFRGGRGGHATTNGTPKDVPASSIPTAESTAWDDAPSTEVAEGGWDTTAPDTTKDTNEEPAQSSWGNVVTAEATPAAASEGVKSSLIPEGGAKKSWASMFSQPPPAPAPAKQAPAPAHLQPAELVASEQVPAVSEEALEEQHEPEPLPLAPTIQEPVAEPIPEPSPLGAPSLSDGDELAITPSKDPLTEENVEHIPDESHAPSTQTVASTVGSVDTRNLTTPLPSQPGPIGSRPPMGGFAASAYRATGVPGRSASFQRRVLEQQEAVVMPGHNAVDRAAVQFGSMGLNGDAGPDVDEDREEPETQQALQHSPPSQPRTSLPPAPMQAEEPVMPQGLPAPKQAPGLPPASQQNQQQMHDAAMAPGLTQDQSQMNPNYSQYGRYGQPGMQQDSKPYDPFSHQAQPSQYDQYGIQQAAQQAPQQAPQQQSQSGFGGLSSAPNDYSSYYTSNEQRNAYNQYYGGSFGPQEARGQAGPQDAGQGQQQRSASGFGAGPNESAYASQAQQQVSRSPSPSNVQAVRETRGDAKERKYLQYQVERTLMQPRFAPPPHQRMEPQKQSQLPESKPVRRPVLQNIHPDVLASVAASLSPESPLHPDYFRVGGGGGKLSDMSNRNLLPPLSSPHPTVYLNQSSDSSNQQVQSRFAEAPGSGQNTPNPLMGGQQQAPPNAQQAQQHAMHQQGPTQQQQQQQPGGYGGGGAAAAAAAAAAGFPYGHPYYNSPYQQAYAAQFGGYGPQAGSGYGGGGFPGKQQGGAMYGAPQGYAMGAQTSYDQHSASPANAGAFGQNQQSSMRSASGMSSGIGGGLDDYGRSSMQSGSHQQSSAFGGMNDPFARSASGFGGQGGYAQQSMGGPEDSLKPYIEAKSGPSPALGQPGRPGSAANSAVGSAQAGLPQAQQSQTGFGAGYPGFPGQGGSQYGGGLGGLGSHQQQQQQQGQQGGMGGQGGYGGYAGAGGFSQTYGNYGSRGGWGSNYGAH